MRKRAPRIPGYVYNWNGIFEHLVMSRMVLPECWMTPEQWAHWRLIGQGEGIHWPDVDEDVSVPHLLGLPCE